MTNQDLYGWLIFFIIFIIIFFIVLKNPKTKNFLFVALFIRLIFVITDHYYFPLPDSDGDAYIFEIFAEKYSEKYGLNVIYYFFTQDSFNISRFISIFYTLLDRSELMAKMFSLGFGTVSIFLIYKLVLILFNNYSALKAAWFLTLFPTFILYSSLILREVYVVFFLTIALIGCINFIKKKKIYYFFKAFFGFLFAALFHGPMIFGFFVFLIYIFFKILKNNNYFLHFRKKNIFYLMTLPILLLPIMAYLTGYYSIPKIGSFNIFRNIENKDKSVFTIDKYLISKIKRATRSSQNESAGANYPSWTVPDDTLALIYLVPVRMSYLLYSPFPWDIKRLKHFLGLLDSFFYIYLFYCIFRNRENLKDKPEIKFLLMVLFSYIFIYSFGVGNFGTSIRHRLKFIGILVAIAAPRINRIKLI